MELNSVVAAAILTFLSAIAVALTGAIQRWNARAKLQAQKDELLVKLAEDSETNRRRADAIEADLKAQKAASEQRNAELVDAAAKVTAESQARIDGLTKQLTETETRLKKLETEQERLRSELADRETDLATERELEAAITTERDNLITDKLRLQSELERVNAEFAAQLKTLHSEIDDLRKRISELEQRNRELEASMPKAATAELPAITDHDEREAAQLKALQAAVEKRQTSELKPTADDSSQDAA